MRTSSHIRRIALTAAIGCTIPAAWSSPAAAVPIGLYDTAPKAHIDQYDATLSAPRVAQRIAQAKLYLIN
jgi:hypothetical protein